MKKNLMVLMAVGMVGNLYAMENGESSTSSMSIVERSRLDEMMAKGGMSKDDFLEGTKRLQVAASEHYTLVAERNILAMILIKRFDIKSDFLCKHLVNAEQLQSIMGEIVEVAYGEKKEAIIEIRKLAEFVQNAMSVEIDNAVFKTQIATMKKLLGMTKKVRRKIARKEKAQAV